MGNFCIPLRNLLFFFKNVLDEFLEICIIEGILKREILDVWGGIAGGCKESVLVHGRVCEPLNLFFVLPLCIIELILPIDCWEIALSRLETKVIRSIKGLIQLCGGLGLLELLQLRQVYLGIYFGLLLAVVGCVGIGVRGGLGPLDVHGIVSISKVKELYKKWRDQDARKS